MSLAGNFPDTAHATSSAEVLKVAQTYSPNVMIISAGLADGPLAGFKTLAVLQSILPFCPVIVMLDDMDRDLIIDAFRAHARAVFCRAEPIQHLIKCVKVVLDGQVWAGSKELKLVLDAFSECTPFHAPASPELLRLTKREFDIATLVAAAQSNKQISRRLNISEHTVKNNLFRIFEKLEIGSRIELAVVMMNMRQSAVSVHAHAQNGDHRVNP
ncbi:MAG: response regulator transcription factor [Acidobacteria bacterium]|nr:response regulator transcription factor [Acidobacteriota bacterium]